MAKKELKLGQVLLKEVRLSFPRLWKAEASVPGAAEKYSANFLIDPSTPRGKANIKSIKAAIEAVELDKFKKAGQRYKDNRMAFKDGNEQLSDATGETYEGYEDMWVIAASNHSRIQIVDRDGRTPLAEDDGKPYAGCYVNALIRFYAVDGADKGGRGLFAYVDAIQFLKDGESFGAGAVNTEDYFDDLGFDEDEEDDDDLI